MLLPLYVDIHALKLVSREGGTLSLPAFTLGDRGNHFELRFLSKDGESAYVETDLNVRSVKANVGLIRAAPKFGSLTLSVEGGDETAAITLATTAQQLITLINDTNPPEDVAEVVIPMTEDATPVAVSGCWLIRFEGGEDFMAEAVANTLAPESFARWRAFQIAGVWWHELRLIQTPLATNEAGFERVLGAAPSIEQIRIGQAQTESLPALNEIQALTRPANFRGTYFLTYEGRKTRILGVEDGVEEIAEALNALYDDGETRFDVTNPEENRAYVEFIGKFAGEPHDLLTVTVNTFEPGRVTFTIDFSKAQLGSCMRNKPSAALYLELEVDYVGDDEDPEDEDIPSRVLTLAQQAVTVVVEMRSEEMDALSPIDFVTPPARRDYIPFTPDQIISGQQHYAVAFGDGSATSFVIAHNLGTDDIAGITVRENIAGGRILTQNDEYQAEVTSDNAVTLIFPVAPDTNGLAVTITTAGPASAFQAHTHTIAQIVGLQAIIDDFETRLQTIEDLLPGGGGTTVPADVIDEDAEEVVTLPDAYEVFPGRFPSAFKAQSFVEGSRDGVRARNGLVRTGLLPAVHDAIAGNASGIIAGDELAAASAHTGALFINDTSEDLLLPGLLGLPSETVPSTPAVNKGAFTNTFGTDTVNLAAHGLVDGQRVRVTTSAADLPVPLAINTDYFVRDSASGTFKLAATPGGAAIDIADDGTGVHTLHAYSLTEGYFASDGRRWYRVARDIDPARTTSWYPMLFERELFRVHVSDKQLRAEMDLDCRFSITAGLAFTNTVAQYLAVIEVGTLPDAATPATTGENIADIIWNTTPLLSQRIFLTPVKRQHDFGCLILRDELGAFTAKKILYNHLEAASIVPAAANFVLRARLVQFDVEDSVEAPRGHVFFGFTGGKITI